MFKQIWTLIRKDLRLWAQRPGEWLIIFIVPLLFMWIMGAVFGKNSSPIIAIFVVNEDAGTSGAKVLRALKDSPNLELTPLSTRAEADRRVGAGEHMAAVIIPPDFSKNITRPQGGKLEIITDPANTEKASIVNGLVNEAIAPIIIEAEVNRAIGRILSGINLNPQDPGSGSQSAQIQKFLSAALKGIVSSQVQDALDNPLVEVEPRSSGGNADRRPPNLMEWLVPGYSLMFVFFLVGSMAITVVEERESGTLRRLLITPTSRASILIGKVLPYFVIAVVQFTLLLVLSTLIFGINLGSSPFALALVILSSAAVVAGMGLLVASLAHSEGQAGGISTLSILTMAVVSGAMFPSIRVPGLELLTPHYWALMGVQNIITRNLGLESVLLPAGILFALAAVFIFVGVRCFKFE
jgi:ABC-2 type transport system permease protein